MKCLFFNVFYINVILWKRMRECPPFLRIFFNEIFLLIANFGLYLQKSNYYV